MIFNQISQGCFFGEPSRKFNPIKTMRFCGVGFILPLWHAMKSSKIVFSKTAFFTLTHSRPVTPFDASGKQAF